MAKKIEDKSEEKKSKSKKIIGTALPGFMQSKPKAIQNWEAKIKIKKLKLREKKLRIYYIFI